MRAVDIATLPSGCGGNADDLAPGAEGVLAGSAVFGDGEARAAELEVVVDRAVGGEDAARVPS